MMQQGTIKRVQTNDGKKRRANSKIPQKLGSDLIRTPGILVAPPNYLPNFSSLWRAQTGSRLDSAHEYRKEMAEDNEKKLISLPQSISNDEDEIETIGIKIPPKLFKQNVSETKIKNLVH